MGKQKEFSYGTSGGGVKDAGPYEDHQHTGRTPVIVRKNGTTIGGARADRLAFDAADLVVDCSGGTADKFRRAQGVSSLLSGTESYVERLKKFAVVRHPDTLFIDWPDMQVPALPWQFWPELLDAMPVGKHVIVNCFGGHGRTGTALACLFLSNAAMDGEPSTAKLAVQFVRSVHCGRAIETPGQLDYIASVAAGLMYRSGATRDEVADRMKGEVAGVRELAGSKSSTVVNIVPSGSDKPATTDTYARPGDGGEWKKGADGHWWKPVKSGEPKTLERLADDVVDGEIIEDDDVDLSAEIVRPLTEHSFTGCIFTPGSKTIVDRVTGEVIFDCAELTDDELRLAWRVITSELAAGRDGDRQ